MERMAYVAVLLGWILSGSALGIVNFDTADPTHNTTPPTGDFAGSGWQYQGLFGSVLATAISPHHFITAKHVGLNGTFVHDALFNESATVTYSVDSSVNGGAGFWDIPDSDLRVFQIAGTFPTWAPLYTKDDEIGKEIISFGRGGGRGVEVMLAPDGLKGWRSAARDGVTRWGRNIVTDTLDDLDGIGQVLAAEFNAVAGVDESHLTAGDSGGGTFIRDTDGVWKLAGINAAVDGRWDTNDVLGDGTDFNAALFDAGGFFVGDDSDGWSLVVDESHDVPSSLYVSRISAYSTEILSVIPEPSHTLWLVLLTVGICRRRRR